MTLLDEAKQIKSDVLRLRAGGARRFGPELRGQILEWISRAEESGMKLPDACRAIGVLNQRITKWRRGPVTPRHTRRRSESLAMVPVTVHEVVRAEVGSITFVTPKGYTISGLTIEQAIGLLQAVS